MAAYKSQIINVVAYHPTVFMVPQEFVAINFAVNISLMMLGYLAVRLSIAVWIITLALGHIVAMIAYNKDPHVVRLAVAYGRWKHRTKNIAPEPGVPVKYVP